MVSLYKRGMDHPALQTLFYPFAQYALDWPQGGAVLFMNAQFDPLLARFGPMNTQQHFAPFAHTLEKSGYSVSSEPPSDQLFDAVLVLGTKNVQETRFMMAQAFSVLRDNGLLVIAAANDAGGKRLAKDMKSLGLETEEDSKHKCRVVWARKTLDMNGARCAEWLEKGSLQPVLDGAFLSQPGLFSWDRADTGSLLLLETLQSAEIKGRGADFGCGYGFLSVSLLRARMGLKSLDYIDADHRAVKACGANITQTGFAGETKGIWHDLTLPLPDKLQYDFIVMNPPFHEGKKTLAVIGQAFIKNAHTALKRGGTLYMVANAHLPYEDILAACFRKCDKIEEKQGFKIFKAVK